MQQPGLATGAQMWLDCVYSLALWAIVMILVHQKCFISVFLRSSSNQSAQSCPIVTGEVWL